MQYVQLGKLDGEETLVILKIYQVQMVILKHAVISVLPLTGH